MARNASTSERLRNKLAESLAPAEAPSTPTPPAPEPAATTPAMTSVSTPEAPAAPVSSTRQAADRIVLTSTLLSAGAGAVPVPIWDAIAIGGVQLKMIADLSAAYGAPFSENVGKSAIATLVGSLAPGLLARGSFGIFFKSLPGIGSAIGAVALPVLAGGCTYALGQVFIRHFESGGTLLTFNPKEFQAGFTQEVKAGMKKVAAIKV